MFRTGAEACRGGASACDCLCPCNGPLRARVRALNPYGLARALTRKGKSSRQPGEELPGLETPTDRNTATLRWRLAVRASITRSDRNPAALLGWQKSVDNL